MFWKLFKSKSKEAGPWIGWLYLQEKCRACGLRISGWLQCKTAALPPRQLKGCCLLFFVVFASGNVAILFQAVRHPVRSLTVAPIQIPQPAPPLVITPGQWHSFRRWLDSLQSDSNGKKIYDTIRKQRPGLLDSLRQIEAEYPIHQ
jgi:hypothetical protein